MLTSQLLEICSAVLSGACSASSFSPQSAGQAAQSLRRSHELHMQLAQAKKDSTGGRAHCRCLHSSKRSHSVGNVSGKHSANGGDLSKSFLDLVWILFWGTLNKMLFMFSVC